MRHRREITHEGVTKSVRAWSQELGIPYVTLINRIQYGWPIARVLLPGKQKRVTEPGA